MQPYPVIFTPIFIPRIWGGRRLRDVLGKQTPDHDVIGESWEIADMGATQSIVRDGAARGATLRQLVEEWGAKLLGGAPLRNGRFPLLVKFLDAGEPLSVQVHPDEATAAILGPGVEAKDEAWYIIDSSSDGVIWRGLSPGIDPKNFASSLHTSQVEQLILRKAARKGHAFYLPGGTVHAMGGGILAAEVQTPSDTTFRMYDWNRVDPKSKLPRELHLQQALQCIRTVPIGAAHERPEHLASVWTTVSSLIRSDSFVMERVRVIAGVELDIPHQEMVIWIVLEGRGTIRSKGASSPTAFAVGDVVLLPAALQVARVTTEVDSVWLELTIPLPSSLGSFERPRREGWSHPTTTPRFVPLNISDRGHMETGPASGGQ